MIKPSQEGQDEKFPAEMTVTITLVYRRRKNTVTIFYPKAENEAQYDAMLKSVWKRVGFSLDKLAASLK